MKRSLQVLITVLLFLTAFTSFSLLAQQPPNQPEPTNKIEGTITAGLSTERVGMPSFTLKTKEGVEYIVHLGTLKNAAGTVFAPQVGDTVSVIGTACCGMAAQTQTPKMIHATEITFGQETFRAAGPVGCMMMGQSGQGMMMHPGQPGQGMQGMMMGHGPASAGQPGMMMCPGMAGHTMAGQAQSAPATSAPGMMSCCGPGGCAGCMMQQAPAAVQQPTPTPEPDPEHGH